MGIWGEGVIGPNKAPYRTAYKTNCHVKPLKESTIITRIVGYDVATLITVIAAYIVGYTVARLVIPK
jgi:hypothetical protein